jgi:hypothetical protein
MRKVDPLKALVSAAVKGDPEATALLDKIALADVIAAAKRGDRRAAK